MNNFFRIIGIFEGISAIVLFFFALPMKRIFHHPEFMYPIGLSHGILFIFYIVLAVILKFKNNWSVKTFLILCLASLVPFGTFYTERKYLRHL